MSEHNEPKPHVHAEMILEHARSVAEGRRREVQFRCRINAGLWTKWGSTAPFPLWNENFQYRFVDDPDRVSPPRKVFQKRVEIPAPLMKLPESGSVFAPCLTGSLGYVHMTTSNLIAREWLKLGIAHVTKERAIAHRDAMLQIEDGCDE